jgi:hypothetical protein
MVNGVAKYLKSQIDVFINTELLKNYQIIIFLAFNLNVYDEQTDSVFYIEGAKVS